MPFWGWIIIAFSACGLGVWLWRDLVKMEREMKKYEAIGKTLRIGKSNIKALRVQLEIIYKKLVTLEGNICKDREE